MEQNQLKVAQQILINSNNQNKDINGGKEPKSFSELLNDDPIKKSHEMKMRRRQEAMEKTMSNSLNPKSSSGREVEKSKLTDRD